MLTILGTIQAGFPTEAEEDVLDTISLDEFLITNKDATYMMRMRGDAMSDAGIFDGDLLIVERTPIARLGDIVITVTDGKYSIGYIDQTKGVCKVEAVVRSVIRKYA